MLKKTLYLIAIALNTSLTAMESVDTDSVVQNLDDTPYFSSRGYDTDFQSAQYPTSEYSIIDACKDGDIETIKACLLENPNAIFTQDEKGRTPLRIALDEGQNEIVDLLLNHNELITSKIDKKEQDSNSDKSEKNASNKNVEKTLKSILDEDNEEIGNIIDEQLLSLAIETGRHDIVDLLLNNQDTHSNKAKNNSQNSQSNKSEKEEVLAPRTQPDKSGKMEVGFPNRPALNKKEQAHKDFEGSLEKIKSCSGNEKIKAILDNFSAYELLKKINPNFAKIWDKVEDSSNNNNSSIPQQSVPNIYDAQIVRIKVVSYLKSLKKEAQAFISGNNAEADRKYTYYQKRILELLSAKDFNELNKYVLDGLKYLDTTSQEINGESSVDFALDLNELIKFLSLIGKLDSRTTDTYGENILSRTQKSKYDFLKKLVRENYDKSRPLLEKAMSFSKNHWGKIFLGSIFLIDGYRQALKYNNQLIWRNPATGRYDGNYLPPYPYMVLRNIKNTFLMRLKQLVNWTT